MATETFTNEQIIQMLFVIAPQFITDDPEVLARYNLLIDALRCMVSPAAFKCCGLIAFANLVAHYLSLGQIPYAGAATSMTEGDLSIGFSSNTGSTDFYGRTVYGQAYASMLANLRLGPFVASGYVRYPGVLAMGWGGLGPGCGC